MKPHTWLIVAAALTVGSAHAASQDVTINLVDAEGKQEAIGSIEISETEHGLLFTPDLKSLPAGVHGFHVHENGSCEPGENDDGDVVGGGAAGGHYDPEDTGTHQGPYGDGDLGDLPVLIVNESGEATLPVLAPRLSLDDVQGRSLMIHEGGDTYSDEPELGGGGGRMACGVVES